MTSNVIKFEVFQKAKANAMERASVDRATRLCVLAYEASQVCGYAAEANLELLEIINSSIADMPDRNHDDAIRASVSLDKAIAYLNIAADSLEAAGYLKEYNIGKPFDFRKYEPEDLPDFSA